MSVINGNIRYFSYYKSLEELRKDENLKPGKLVSVITNDNIDVDYSISTVMGENGIKLNSGLYANPIFTGNSLSAGVSQVFSSVRPSDYDVGGIKKGDEFAGVALTTFLNKLINGTETIVATFWDGASADWIYRRGELVIIEGVTVNIESTYYPVVQVLVYSNNELVITQECDVTEGHINIPCRIPMRDTTEVSVRIYDEKDNGIRLSMIHHFEDPVFYDVLSADAVPGVTMFDSATAHYGLDDLIITKTFSAQELVIAVPESMILANLYDENNIISDNIWRLKYVNTYSTSSYSCNYHFFVSESLSVDNFTFRATFKENS